MESWPEVLGFTAGSVASILLVLFLLVLAVLWFLLPFAVFGVKGKLSKIEHRLARIDRVLVHEFGQRRPGAAPAPELDVE